MVCYSCVINVFLSGKLSYLIYSSRERLGKRENVGGGGMAMMLWCVIALRGSGNGKDKDKGETRQKPRGCEMVRTKLVLMMLNVKANTESI